MLYLLLRGVILFFNNTMEKVICQSLYLMSCKQTIKDLLSTHFLIFQDIALSLVELR